MEMSDPDYSLKASIQPSTSQKARERWKSVRTWINKWCRDLLEVQQTSASWTATGQVDEPKVQFLHRTVRDYLTGEDIQLIFERDAGQQFNPRLSLCRSYLATAKSLHSGPLDRPPSREFVSIAGYFMFHAKEYEANDGFTPFSLVQELDRTGQINARTFSGLHWTYSCPREPTCPEVVREASTFLCYAVECDLQLFIKKLLAVEPSRLLDSDSAVLCQCALRPSVKHETLIHHDHDGIRPRYEVLTILIEKGLPVTKRTISTLDQLSTSDAGAVAARAAAMRFRRRNKHTSLEPDLEPLHDSDGEFGTAGRESSREDCKKGEDEDNEDKDNGDRDNDDDDDFEDDDDDDDEDDDDEDSDEENESTLLRYSSIDRTAKLRAAHVATAFGTSQPRWSHMSLAAAGWSGDSTLDTYSVYSSQRHQRDKSPRR